MCDPQEFEIARTIAQFARTTPENLPPGMAATTAATYEIYQNGQRQERDCAMYIATVKEICVVWDFPFAPPDAA